MTQSVSVTMNVVVNDDSNGVSSGVGAISLLLMLSWIATLTSEVGRRASIFLSKSKATRVWCARLSTSAILFVIPFLSFAGLPEIAVADDWEVRSTHPDVVYSNRFDDYDSDFYANLWPNPDYDRRSSYFDTQVKASGAGSLRFDIIPGGSGFGGELAISLGDDPATQFGAGDEFWVQWRQRFDPYVIDHYYATTSGNGQWKHLIIGQGQLPGQSRWDTRSCTENDIVVQNISGKKYPQSYHGCWVYLNIESSSGLAISRMNFGDETGDSGADEAERWPCQYWPPGSRTDGCKFYAPDQWMTFMVHVQLGPDGETTSSIGGGLTKGFTNSTYELYAAYDGEELELVHRTTGIVFRRGNYDDDPRNSSHDAKFGMFRWTPYLTQKDPAENHQTASTWIDEIIISRSFIESPGPVVRPMPPTDVN